ncbi:MAG: hypothetical protein J0H06_16540 [Actinobacteria bacterium]|nr:hypothetical protein [Actinomycetota bacterium]
MATEPPALPVGRPPQPRRCRHRAAPRRDGDLRPTDVVSSFFICGIAFLVAAAVAAIVQAVAPWPWGRWLALHLAFVGGISQLVLGAGQFFVGAFLATDPPPRRLVRAQLAAWNLGAIGLALAIPLDAGTAVWIAVGLRLGLLAGSLLAHGVPWAQGDLLGAHMSLNLAGWFGGAIVGTLHTFYPSLTQTQLRHPRLQPLSFAAWNGGVAALAIGYAWALDPLAIAGWLALCLGALALLINVVASLRGAVRPLSLAARLVGAAQPFLLAALVVATTAAIDRGPDEALVGATRATVGTLLVAGWIGLTVLGSLLHLLAVVVRVRGGFTARMPDPRPRLDRLVSILAMLAVAALALAQKGGPASLHAPARWLLIAVYAMLALRVARLAGRVLLAARPSI